MSVNIVFQIICFYIYILYLLIFIFILYFVCNRNALQMRHDGQKSLRDYFTSEKPVTVCDASERRFASRSKRTVSDDEAERLSSTPARKRCSIGKHVIVVDSDEENVFERCTKYRNSSCVHSTPQGKGLGGDRGTRGLSMSAGRKPSGQSRTWSCVACTYINHPLISYCEMCSTDRPTSTEPWEQSNAAVDSVSTQSVAIDSVSEQSRLASAVAQLAFLQENSNNCPSSSLQESRTASPDVFLESDADDASALNNLSSRSAPSSNTSLLETLSIDTDTQVDAGSLPSSHEDMNAAGDGDGDGSHTSADMNAAAAAAAGDGDGDGCHTATAAAELSCEWNSDVTSTAVHESFQYCCSRNSSRIYVYDKVLLTD